MARFRVAYTALGAEIVFDDAGMNLLSSDALRELRDILDDIAVQSFVVFRSGRERLFAAGADMAEMQRFTAWEAHDFARLGQEVFATLERLPCLTVALIDGDCFGGALDLVLAFDLRFATPRSRFSHPGARLGIVTGFGGTSRWRRTMTRPAAHQLFLVNDVFSAEEALALQLVDRVHEEHERELARVATLDVALVKQLTNRAERLSRSQLLRLSQLV
jgi:enoyl-CoA hydratase/carnithine racemase